MKARITIAILAVALIVAAVAMAYAQNATGTTKTPAAKAGWRPEWHKGWAPRGVTGQCKAANITPQAGSSQSRATA